MLRCELPLRSRTPQKERNGKGMFSNPFSKSSRPSTSPISPRSHQRSPSGGSSIELRLPFGLGRCKHSRNNSEQSFIAATYKDLPLLPDSACSSASSSAESLVISQAQAATSFSLALRGDPDYFGLSGKRRSVAEELISPADQSFTFPRRFLYPPRSSSVPNYTARPKSFSERLGYKTASSSDSEVEVSYRGRRRPPPPPIMIPSSSHRRQLSVPINYESNIERIPSISIQARRQATPPLRKPTSSSSRLATQPNSPAPSLPSLRSLAPSCQPVILHSKLQTLERLSQSSSGTTDSGATITPPRIVQAHRSGPLRSDRGVCVRAKSPTRAPPDIMEGATAPFLPKVSSDAQVPMTGTFTAPLTATAFPSSPSCHSVVGSEDLHGNHLSFSSCDIHALPFRSPHNLRIAIPPPPLPPIATSAQNPSQPAQGPVNPTVLTPSCSTTSSVVSSSMSLTSLPSTSTSPSPKITANSVELLLSQSSLIMQASSASASPVPTFPPEPLQHSSLQEESQFLATLLADSATPLSPLAFPWLALPPSEAKRALSVKELQSIITDAIKESSSRAPALVVSNFDELPQAVASAKKQLEELQYLASLEADVRARTLFRHVACLRAVNGDEGARFAQSLVKAVSKSDRLSQQMSTLAEHIRQMELLQESHYRAATTISLGKLNTAFVRSREAESNLQKQLEATRLERDDAVARLKALEAKFETFANRDGTLLLTPHSLLDSDGRRPSSLETVSLSLSELRVQDFRFPMPPPGEKRRSPATPPAPLPPPASNLTLRDTSKSLPDISSLSINNLFSNPRPAPSPFASDASPVVPDMLVHSSARSRQRRQGHQKAAFSTESMASPLNKRRDADMYRSVNSRSRSASESHVVVQSSSQQALRTPEASLLENMMETLALTGQVPATLTSAKQDISLGGSRSNGNLSSITLSELDSSELAQMLELEKREQCLPNRLKSYLDML